MVPYLNKAQGLTYWYKCCRNCVFQINFGVEKMEFLTEMRQCRRREFSVGSPLVIEGFRALSHTFSKSLYFLGRPRFGGLRLYLCP